MAESVCSSDVKQLKAGRPALKNIPLWSVFVNRSVSRSLFYTAIARPLQMSEALAPTAHTDVVVACVLVEPFASTEQPGGCVGETKTMSPAANVKANRP